MGECVYIALLELTKRRINKIIRCISKWILTTTFTDDIIYIIN